MKILVVEDNQQIASDIEEYLKIEHFVVEKAENFRLAQEKIMLYNYDLAVVDLGLPDGDGLDLLAQIRQHKPQTGVIILTAKHDLQYKLRGLDQGADDYLTKPFHLAELNARIRTVLRRKLGTPDSLLKIGDMQLDIASAEVKINDKLLYLTRKEYNLLLFFVTNKNRLLTKESIAEHLWGDHADQADNFDFVYNHIKNLRRKITAAGAKDYLKSMYGMGYKFEIND